MLFESISIHALREEGDPHAVGGSGSSGISIHALREEGDVAPSGRVCALDDFYPRPPRGGRPAEVIKEAAIAKFLSTPSARRATWRSVRPVPPGQNFYPRPPRGGRRLEKMGMQEPAKISIHALREEGDSKCDGQMRI